MKKKEQKKKIHSKVNSSNDSRSQRRELSDDLGMYGLEPPKIYRNSQADAERRTTRKPKSDKRRTANSSKSVTRHQYSHTENVKPTIQQKRANQNKKRRLKKKVRRALGILGIVLAMAAVIIVLCLTVLFKIDTIKVTGNNYYTTKQITAVLPIDKEQNLFLADKGGASTKLEKNLPYIKSVNIKRKFPSTIIVEIIETDNIFAVKNKDKTYTLLDSDLKVLEPNVAKAPKNAIIIKKLAISNAVAGELAETTNEKQKKNILEMTRAIEKLKLQGEITEIYSDDINNNFMMYKNRILFKIGSTTDIENKLYSALAATDKLNQTDPQVTGEMTVSGDKQIYFTEK